MTKSEAEALLRNMPKRELTPEERKSRDYYDAKAIEYLYEAGLTKEECMAQIVQWINDAYEKELRLVMEGYPPELAMGEACGFHPNTNLLLPPKQ